MVMKIMFDNPLSNVLVKCVVTSHLQLKLNQDNYVSQTQIVLLCLLNSS